MILIDTNVLLYACAPEDPRHRACRTLLDQAVLRPREYCLTWLNLFEYLRVTTHARILPDPLPFETALGNVRSFAAALPLIHPSEGHLDTVSSVAQDLAPVRGDRVFDCRIAAILLENGGSRILSYDTRFRRVKGIEVLVPD